MNILVLDATTKTLQAVTTAYSSVQPNFTVHYADATAGSFVEGSADGVVPTTVGIILAAPASLARRVVKEITIYNGDTGSVTVTLYEYNNTTPRVIKVFTLGSGETFSFSESSPEKLGGQIHASANKATPVDADEVGIWNSVTGLLGKISWSSIKSTLGLGSPGASGNVLTSNGSTWASATPPATAHIAASANVHGLPANVNVLGNRSAAGEFVQRGTVTTPNAEISYGGGYTEPVTLTYPVAFSATPRLYTTSANLYATTSLESQTQTTVNINANSFLTGAVKSCPIHWLAIGT